MGRAGVKYLCCCPGLALCGRYGFFPEAPGDPAFDARKAFFDAGEVGFDAVDARLDAVSALRLEFKALRLAFKLPYKRHCRPASATPTPIMAQNSGFTASLLVL